MALTKFNYNSFDLTTAASKGLAFNSSANGFETAAEGSMTLIKTLTASSSSTLSFVDGSSDVVLDNTYPVYLFKFINIHPATNEVHLELNFSTDSGSNYNVTKTTTVFTAAHYENGSQATLRYGTSPDLAQSTSNQRVNNEDFVGNENDESITGELYLFNPSSTTFVKHFMIRTIMNSDQSLSADNFVAGYCNTTSAVDGVRFDFSSGNIDSGTIKLYGIKDS